MPKKDSALPRSGSGIWLLSDLIASSIRALCAFATLSSTPS
ncbi:hypothetical protein [Streptomyces melanogenes]|uniref:Uncharacterized protein n=1 Tax=Streptomyces melanogenes TaxID=67326 RepID=A0ABZ1XDL6_9ACTN|nr:hypothetical protein [Streptomyces melanogenes]